MHTAQQKVEDIRAFAPLPEPRITLPAFLVRGMTGFLCGTADLAVLGVSLILVALLANGIGSGYSLIDLLAMRISVEHLVVLVMVAIIWRSTFWYCDLYTWQRVRSAEGLFGRLALASWLCAWVSGCAVAILWHHGHFWRSMGLCWLISLGGACAVRSVLAGYFAYVRPLFRKGRNVIIVGGGPQAEHMHKELISHQEWRYTLLGFVSTDRLSTPAAGGRILGGVGDLEDILMRHVVDEVVIVLPIRSQYEAVERVVAICERAGIQVQCCTDIFETSVAKRVYSEENGAMYRIVLKMVHEDRRHHLKRALDIAGASCGLVLLSPLFLVVAILIKTTSKGPVLFRQKRCGLHKRVFHIYKFRSMVVNAEAAQAQLEHMNQNNGPVFKIFADPRVTKIGAFLRKTSIDELPQLFNVLKGEMSLVGPRPLNLRDVGRFSEPWLMRRFSVKPGLTCLWQISGRSTVSFSRWIALDLDYIDNWSLLLDLKILARTLPAVIKCRGAA